MGITFLRNCSGCVCTGTNSSKALHWPMAVRPDNDGDSLSLPEPVRNGCMMYRRLDDWTWRTSNVWSWVQMTAVGAGAEEATEVGCSDFK